MGKEGRWVSGSREVSVRGAGVARGEKAQSRWLLGRGPGSSAGLFPGLGSLPGTTTPAPLLLPPFVSPPQTTLCLLKEMPPTFRDTSAAVW